jgi:hypothetical protein
MLLLAVDVGMSDLMIDVNLNDPILLISDLYPPGWRYHKTLNLGTCLIHAYSHLKYHSTSVTQRIIDDVLLS